MGKHLLILLLLLAGACGPATPAAVPEPTATPAPSSFPLEIEQSDGEVLTLEAPPQRIVSLASHATDILCATGAGEQLVAVEAYANCPPGSEEKPQLDAFQPNLEAITAFEPDLVYVFADMNEIVAALRRVDVPVLYLVLPSTLEGVLEHIELFGRISGHEAEADELVASLEGRMAEVETAIAEVETGPRVFHELDPTYFTVAPESFVGDFYTRLKAQNIAARADSPYLQLSAELIVERDPEVIVLADEASGVTPESVKERPGWEAISAVANDRICVVAPDLVSRPGPNIAEGLETLAECLYPERFP